MTRRKLVNPVRVPGTASDSDRSQDEGSGRSSPLASHEGLQTEALNCCVHERAGSPLRLTKRSHEEAAADTEAKRQAIDYSLPRRDNGDEAAAAYAKTMELLVNTHAAPHLLSPLFPAAQDSLLALQSLYGGLAFPPHQQQQALAVDLSPASSASSDFAMPRPPSQKALKMEPSLSALFAAVASRALELKYAIEHYRAKVETAERKAAQLLAKPTTVNGLQPSPASLPSPLFPRSQSPAGSDVASEVASLLCDKKGKAPVMANGGGGASNNATPRRRNDRRSDAEMNEPNISFQPEMFLDAGAVEQVRLSSLAPDITLPHETYAEIMKKGESSATRVIRMLMKHFFPPEILAASSLSGTGTYKQILDEGTITAIRDFINHRYPKLKNSRLNLCMTDVCVQARRVKTNQTKRTSDIITSVATSLEAQPQSGGSQASPLDTNSSRSHHEEPDYDLHVSAPSLPMALERPISPPSSDELERNLVIETSM